MMQRTLRQRPLEKGLLLLFLSPLLTVAILYHAASGGQLGFSNDRAQPLLFALVLFWIWQSSSRELSAERKEPS
jgi:hypothetical protein